MLYRYGHPVRLIVEAVDEYKYAFSAASASNPAHVKHLGYRDATIVSGGSGPFTGEYSEFVRALNFRTDDARHNHWCVCYYEWERG